MKVGLVHGRFQPFHNGHKFLVDKMLKECDLGVILIGSAQKKDKKNPYTLKQRKEMIMSIYKNKKKLFIGANIDLDSPYSKKAQWDVVLASCVLSLTGYLPTHIYGGVDYDVPWKRVRVNIKKHKRYNSISATNIKKSLKNKKVKDIQRLVPKEVFNIIRN